MKIRKNDQVLIIKGKDKGKKGKVLKGLPKESKVLVEGVNIKKKSQKPRKEGEKGQVVGIPFPICVSSVKIICPKCGKPARIGCSLSKSGKNRICKKCGGEI